MSRQKAILIFDIGKTNKKVLLFDEHYNIIHEESAQLNEKTDEDGFACEDVDALTNWIRQKFSETLLEKDIEIKAINFSAYGASLVHLNESKKVITPLYNYLKPFPQKLKHQFYDTYGGEDLLAKETASPVLGNLNSGLQLYRLKYERPEIYEQIKYTLHLPQYLSFLVSGKETCDITSIGCHTHLWDFQKDNYHDWVYKERLLGKFPSIFHSNKTFKVEHSNQKIAVGVGLHDSSAALIPYLKFFYESFILISTGTWCISLNPFNHTLLSDYELQNDCLCYLDYEGRPVKASRLFAGYEHEQQLKRLALHFNTTDDYYKTLKYADIVQQLQPVNSMPKLHINEAIVQGSVFNNCDLNDFKTYEVAYYQLIIDIISQQIKSTQKVLSNTPVKRIFVDGGFGKNDIYMNLLASAFDDMEVFAATIPQASAYGAAIAIHNEWNKNPIPDLINLVCYKATENVE